MNAAIDKLCRSIHTISVRPPIVYFYGSHVEFSKIIIVFLSLTVVLILANSAVFNVCQSTHLGVSSIQMVN